MVKLPSVDPLTDDPSPGRDLIKLFQAATKAQKTKGDSYLGVDVLLREVINHVRRFPFF